MFNLSVNNFRSFKQQEFDFSKINILIGENSSGKSSIIKFLLLLSKSTSLNSSCFHFNSDIGKYNDFVFSQNSKLKISFSISLGQDYIKFFIENFGKRKEWKPICDEIKLLDNTNNTIVLKFQFDKNVQSTNHVILSIENKFIGKIEIERIKDTKKDVLLSKQCQMKFTDFEDGKYHEEIFNELGYDQQGFLSYIHSSDLQKRIDDKYSKGDHLFYQIAFLLISQNYLEQQLSLIKYINPLESTPERIYKESENIGVYSVRNISDVVNILTDETVEEKSRLHLLVKLNAALKSYGILNEIKPINSGFGAKELRVQVSEGGIWLNIKDVGYGSALQIPILFQAILSDMYGGETIIIEQPEIHIHPFLQSKFIETLIEVGKKNSYIIETHSEDIIRKLQVMSKNNSQINHNSVKIFYFKRSEKNGCEISKHEINEHGKLIPSFPSGFYDSSSSLVKELMK